MAQINWTRHKQRERMQRYGYETVRGAAPFMAPLIKNGRLDQLRQAQKETVGLARPPGSNQHRVKEQPDATLASQGIDKNLAQSTAAGFIAWRAKRNAKPS